MFYTEDNNYYLAIGTIGLILTHNISTLITGIFALFYFIFNIEKVKEERIRRSLIINIIFIILVTSFFWLPMLETSISAHYQVYEDGAMSSKESIQNYALKLKQLFVSINDGSYVFELGPYIIIILAFSVLTLRLIKQELKENYIIFLFSGLISLWMSTKYFPWKLMPEEFCIIQFPWRMLMASAFFLSIVCAINIYTIIKKFNIKDVAIIGIIAVCYSIAFIPFIPKEDTIQSIEELRIGEFSGREYEVVVGAGKGEYLPKKAFENRFYIASREDNIYVIEGKAIIENEKKENGILTANIQTLEADYTVFELPYIYYPGYEVRLDGMVAESFQTKNGFLGFVMLKEDTAELKVSYKGTKLMKYTSFISGISFIIFAVYIWKKH